MATAAPGLVDPLMLARTTEWLLGRRVGTSGENAGSFARSDRSLDSFGAAPALVTDAYIVYALVAHGGRGGGWLDGLGDAATLLEAEISALRARIAPAAFDDPCVFCRVTSDRRNEIGEAALQLSGPRAATQKWRAAL